MPLHIKKDDITKISCDAIVNAANSSLLGGGGVDGCIHRAAGRRLLEECKTLGGCKTGEAKITKGYDLPCKYVIHTVGPIWRGGNDDEDSLLYSCYKNSLELAKAHDCQTVAFPLISTGAYRYPKKQALQIATKAVKEFLQDNEMTVYVVVFDKNAFQPDEILVEEVAEFIENNFCDAEEIHFENAPCHQFDLDEDIFDEEEDFDLLEEEDLFKQEDLDDHCYGSFDQEGIGSSPSPFRPKRVLPRHQILKSRAKHRKSRKISTPEGKNLSLDEMLASMDDGFVVSLLKLIDDKGINDVDCYKKANVSRQTWYKIMNDKNYKPSKNTVIAFAISLELSLEETKALLRTAGYTLSKSNKFDVIIEYFLLNEQYDVFVINETLFKFDQTCLGV